MRPDRLKQLRCSAVVLLPIVRSISDKMAKRPCTGFLSRTLRQVQVELSTTSKKYFAQDIYIALKFNHVYVPH